MSSEITSSDYMVSAGNVVPWHKLGAIMPDKALTAIIAAEAAKLQWEVKGEPIFDLDAKQIPEQKLLRRSDNREVLSIVPEGWNPVQNLQLLEIAEALAQAPGEGDFQPVIETAGSLKGGRIVWALVQTGNRQFAGSQHKQYLLLSNGHYLGRGVRGTLTDTRVVCWNTLSAAENASASLFTNHYGNVEARIEAAIDALGWATAATKSTFAIDAALPIKPCSKDVAATIYTELLHKKPKQVDNEEDDEITSSEKQKVEEMLALFASGAGNEGKTMFDMVNGATDWVDHFKEYRNSSEMDERRFLDVAIGGNGASLKKRAVKLALAYGS